MGSQAITDEENMGDQEYDEYWRKKNYGFLNSPQIHKNKNDNQSYDKDYLIM